MKHNLPQDNVYFPVCEPIYLLKFIPYYFINALHKHGNKHKKTNQCIADWLYITRLNYGSIFSWYSRRVSCYQRL